MKTDKDKTAVIFRMFRDKSREVIAIFPLEPWSHDLSTCASYMHNGQHGAASVHLAARTRPATRKESAPLRRELRAIGYNLRELRRFPNNALFIRRSKLQPAKP